MWSAASIAAFLRHRAHMRLRFADLLPDGTGLRTEAAPRHCEGGCIGVSRREENRADDREGGHETVTTCHRSSSEKAAMLAALHMRRSHDRLRSSPLSSLPTARCLLRSAPPHDCHLGKARSSSRCSATQSQSRSSPSSTLTVGRQPKADWALRVSAMKTR